MIAVLTKKKFGKGLKVIAVVRNQGCFEIVKDPDESFIIINL